MSPPVRRGSLGPDPVAVVEVGSGSVKLLVTDEGALAAGRPDPLHWAIKTRLWSRGARTLDPVGLEATREAFGRFAAVLAEEGIGPGGAEPRVGDDVEAGPDPEVAPGVGSVAVVGTAVTREAADADVLDELSHQVLGVPLEVLGGDREAELGLAGATVGRDLPGPLSLIDIGAGSTEVATQLVDGTEGSTASIGTCSLPIGARVLTDAYLHGDPPGPDELSSALSVIELHYDDLRRELPQFAPALAGGTLLGVGAIGQIAAVEIGLADPNDSVDGHVLAKADVEEVFRTLATESAADRAHNPGLLPEHVDDIVGGLCVLVELMRRFDVAELVVSGRNLRHGRAVELLAGRSVPPQERTGASRRG